MKQFNMFKNSTTEKLQCWNCEFYKEGKCPIFVAFARGMTSIPPVYRMQLDKIYFRCKDYSKIKRM